MPKLLGFYALPPATILGAMRLAEIGHRAGLGSLLLEQLRQPRDVDGDPPRLVLREHLRLQSFGRIVARIQIGQRLAVSVADV